MFVCLAGNIAYESVNRSRCHMVVGLAGYLV